jgi:hypothetical protein
MDYQSLIQFIFYGILGFVAIRGVKTLDKLHESVEKLNEKMAVIIKESQWHERWLIRHDEELNQLKHSKGE